MAIKEQPRETKRVSAGGEWATVDKNTGERVDDYAPLGGVFKNLPQASKDALTSAAKAANDNHIYGVHQPSRKEQAAQQAIYPNDNRLASVNDLIGRVDAGDAPRASRQATAHATTQATNGDPRPTFNESLGDYATNENQKEYEEQHSKDFMTDDERREYRKKARRAQVWQAVTDGIGALANFGTVVGGGLPVSFNNLDKTRAMHQEELDRDRQRADRYWERWRAARAADRELQRDRYNDAYARYKQSLDDWTWRNITLPEKARKERMEDEEHEWKGTWYGARTTNEQAKTEKTNEETRKTSAMANNLESGKTAQGGNPNNSRSSGGGRGGSGGGGGKNYVAGRSYPTAGDADAAALSYAKGHNIPTTKVVEEEDQYGLKTRRTVNMSKTEIRQIVNDHYAAQNGGGNNSNRGNGGGNRGGGRGNTGNQGGSGPYSNINIFRKK